MVSNLAPVQQLVSSRYSIVCNIQELSGVYLETGSCHAAYVLQLSGGNIRCLFVVDAWLAWGDCSTSGHNLAWAVYVAGESTAQEANIFY